MEPCDIYGQFEGSHTGRNNHKGSQKSPHFVTGCIVNWGITEILKCPSQVLFYKFARILRNLCGNLEDHSEALFLRVLALLGRSSGVTGA